MREFTIDVPERIVFGPGAEARTAEQLTQLGAERVLVVCQPHHRAGADRVARALGDRCLGVHAEARAQVPREVANAGIAAAEGADWVLAHGGGTAVGLAKAIALEREVRVGAVVTTYSGSERTNIWGITTDGVKTTGRDDRVRPQLVVYDPELLAALPVTLAQQSLFNALAHSAEALYDPTASPKVLDAATQSVRPLLDGLRALADDPTGVDGLSEALYGAYLAATALDGASLALHHKICHVLGGTFGTPHAATHQVVLPYALAFNGHLDRLAEAMGTDDPPAALYDLARSLGLPTSLKALGVEHAGLDRAADLAVQKRYANPREFDRDDVVELLDGIWHDRRPSLFTQRVDGLSWRGPRDATHAILAVHGRGASADRLLADLERALGGRPEGLALVAPQAFDNTWYPKGYRRPPEENQPFLDRALATLDAARARLPERVTVVGFSQGACLGLTWVGHRGEAVDGVFALSGSHIDLPMRWNLHGTPVRVSTSEGDRWLDHEAVRQTVSDLRAAGADVTFHVEPGDRHAIFDDDQRALRAFVEQWMSGDDLQYLSGFGNELASEARPGALPGTQNTPRRPPYGLYAEQINGTGFTVSQALNRRTWMYRLRPQVHARPFEPVSLPRFAGRYGDFVPSPELVRWKPMPAPAAHTDWVSGITTLVGAGDPLTRSGMAVHHYGASTDMKRAFANGDGDLVLAPYDGRIRVRTELGWLQVEPGEVLIVPRGLRFAVHLVDPTAAGFAIEVFDGHVQLPEHGLLGPNGLASARHFLAPVADYEDRAQATEIVVKQGGRFFRTQQPHSPFDVVAWHGNYAPFKYDLRQFQSYWSASWDHPDPSVLTALTVPADTHGRNALDFAVFLPRWDVTAHTFRPPFLHRNSAVEFNGILRTRATKGPWQKGAFQVTPYLTHHGVAGATYRRELGQTDAEADRPEHISEGLVWMQLESCYPLAYAPWMLEHPSRDADYLEQFTGYPEGELIGQ